MNLETHTPPLHILLVEDNLADSLLLSSMLNERLPEAQITVIGEGEEAVDALLRRGNQAHVERPDVVLLDLNLPRRNGFEILAEARAHPALRHLPVFLMTTSASGEDARRAKALGVVDFITKPSDLPELEALVERLAGTEFPRLFSPTRPSPETALPAPKDQRTGVSAESFRLLVDAVSDYAIFMLDPNGYILTWNAGAQRAKQYVASEVLGKHFSIFYRSEEIADGHPAYELEVAAREGRYQEEGWRLRKDGSLFRANVTITAIRSENGDLLGYSKVTRDMTEHYEAEQKLRESEERFRILVESVRDYAIFMIDPQGRIVSWNRGAERINGYRASEALGKSISIFYTEEANARNHCAYELEIAEKKGTYEEEGIRVRKDGSTFWANVVITAIYGGDGKLTGFAKVTRDVTERKKTEQEIRSLNTELEQRVEKRTRELEESKALLEEQQEKLLRSNSDLQQFAYVASHDLQEPLRVVVSYLQLLQRRSKDKLDPESQSYIDFAVEGAAKMRTLVRDLLSYARIDKTSETYTPIDFGLVAADVARNLEHSLLDTNTQLTIGPLPRIPADGTQMVQVIQNLVANAIAYRSLERPAEIHVGAIEGEDNWTVFVRDNGIGIAPEYFQKIFVIFQRLHGDLDRFPGTGIGLSICKKVIDRHGGRIWVESTLGQGSTFAFSLPKNP